MKWGLIIFVFLSFGMFGQDSLKLAKPAVDVSAVLFNDFTEVYVYMAKDSVKIDCKFATESQSNPASLWQPGEWTVDMEKVSFSTPTSSGYNYCKARCEGYIDSDIISIEIQEDTDIKPTEAFVSRTNAQYPGRGAQGLADGVKATANYKNFNWQGHDSVFTVTYTFKKKVKIDDVVLSYLVDTPSWIIAPCDVEIAVYRRKKKKKIYFKKRPSYQEAENGMHFMRWIACKEMKYGYDMGSKEPFWLETKTAKTKKITIRITPGVLPADHPGAGKTGWVFIDEILVK